MVDHVARVLCRAAGSDPRRDGLVCPHCDDIDERTGTAILGECTMWPTFRREAACAIEGVRNYARLDMRRKPRQRSAVEVVGGCERGTG